MHRSTVDVAIDAQVYSEHRGNSSFGKVELAGAEQMRPHGNDEAILRWNTCVRMLGRHEPAAAPSEYVPALED